MPESPVEVVWRCPRCRSTYVSDVGECGQNQPFVCRERVRPGIGPTERALERARAAYDQAFDDGGGGATDDEIVDAVISGLFEDADTFETLVTIAEAILELHYPESVFTDAWREGLDPGHKLIVALRSVAAARNGTAAS